MLRKEVAFIPARWRLVGMLPYSRSEIKPPPLAWHNFDTIPKVMSLQPNNVRIVIRLLVVKYLIQSSEVFGWNNFNIHIGTAFKPWW